MVRVRGLYINLEEAAERREQISGHLQELGLKQTYQRFPACRSDPAEAAARNLSVGELGLWKSWLALLEEQVDAAETNEFDYLHILEDDAELSSLLPAFLQGLGAERSDFDLLFTEIYVNPPLWQILQPEVEAIRKSNTVVLYRKHYTGCASSVLIPRGRIRHVEMVLRKNIEDSQALLPLDNSLRLLKQDGQLSMACTIPFLSAVRLAGIGKSTIQSQKDENDPQRLTQELNALLRRQLSVLWDDGTTAAVMQVILRLAEAQQNEQCAEQLLEAGVCLAIYHALPRYRVDPRLKGQPDNRQL